MAQGHVVGEMLSSHLIGVDHSKFTENGDRTSHANPLRTDLGMVLERCGPDQCSMRTDWR